MASSFLPRTDSGLRNWVNNFSTLISADPTVYGLTVQQATDFADLATAYIDAYDVANTPTTRTSAAIAAKDDARTNVRRRAGLLSSIIQGQSTVTNQQKVDLGLTVRDVEPTPAPVPATAPLIEVVSVVGRTVRLKLKDAIGEGRGKPLGVIGATVFSCVSETAPASVADWKYEGITGGTVLNVAFPDTVAAGATVWFTAQWFNSRKEAGPGTPALSTNLQGGAAQAA